MKRLPPRPDIGHLKKQAKELLAAYRGGDPAALVRLRESLPAAAGRGDAAITSMDLRLHDAQSCVAREYGFPSWALLQGFVAARQALAADPARAVRHWLSLVYAGDIADGNGRARPALAARLLEEQPDLPGDDPHLACAVGDEARLREAIARDAGWVHRAGGPLALPPLVAVTHSSLLRLPAFSDKLRACAQLLLAAGADPNQSCGNRWPSASVQAPDEAERLSALYGAAGQNHDPLLTQLLLEAGANPNDGESLYHALDSRECTLLLLEAGARVTGSNAMYRVLDLDDVEVLNLLLAHGGDPNEPASNALSAEWGTPLLWAIRRRRSAAHVQALLDAGADAHVKTPEGISAHALALRFGLTEVAQVLEQAGAGSAQAPDAQFVAACARADEAEARRLLAGHPQLVANLTPPQLRLLPEFAAQPGCGAAVQLMVRLGWPIATTGGDWSGSALNMAVFRGDAALARFLLEHGASWQERHGFGDDVRGSLSWASCNEPVDESTDADGGDWVGCAQALQAHGLPEVRRDPKGSDFVLVGGAPYRFSEEVTDCLLGAG